VPLAIGSRGHTRPHETPVTWTLGHAQLAITADTYTSVILELQHTHADAAANLIPRQGSRR